jgi:NADP oxidoreductase coenzyme F420-dependent
MTTAVIGTGGIGSVIARELASGGETLRLASADNESARTLAAEIGRAAVVAVDNDDALRGADAVVLALRFAVLKGVIDEIADPLAEQRTAWTRTGSRDLAAHQQRRHPQPQAHLNEPGPGPEFTPISGAKPSERETPVQRPSTILVRHGRPVLPRPSSLSAAGIGPAGLLTNRKGLLYHDLM